MLGAVSGALAINGGTLDVQGYNVNVGALAGAGLVRNLSGSGTLTVGNGDASGTFSGYFEDASTIPTASGQLSLIKVGSGTLGINWGCYLACGGTLAVNGGLVSQSGAYVPAPDPHC